MAEKPKAYSPVQVRNARVLILNRLVAKTTQLLTELRKDIDFTPDQRALLKEVDAWLDLGKKTDMGIAVWYHGQGLKAQKKVRAPRTDAIQRNLEKAQTLAAAQGLTIVVRKNHYAVFRDGEHLFHRASTKYLYEHLYAFIKSGNPKYTRSGTQHEISSPLMILPEKDVFPE